VAAAARNTTYYHHLLFWQTQTEKFLVSVDLNESLPVFEKGLLNSSVKKISFTQKRPIQFTCMNNSDVAKKYNNKIQSRKKKHERKKSTRY